MVGGWASDLLDRLGTHYWTAPGSIRGAVDFISAASRCWNLADFFIVGATPLFLLATAQLAKRAANRPPPAHQDHAIRNSPRARVPIVAVAGAALVMTVALGAAHHRGLTKPSHTSTANLPACAPSSRTGVAVRQLGPACPKEPAKTAVRRSEITCPRTCSMSRCGEGAPVTRQFDATNAERVGADLRAAFAV